MSPLENVIVAALEEAGEENACALLNTVVACRGRTEEIKSFSAALQELLAAETIQVAVDVDSRTLKLTPSSKDVAVRRISRMGSSVFWDTDAKSWVWADPIHLQMFHIVLTSCGEDIAHQLLSKHGAQFI